MRPPAVRYDDWPARRAQDAATRQFRAKRGMGRSPTSGEWGEAPQLRGRQGARRKSVPRGIGPGHRHRGLGGFSAGGQPGPPLKLGDDGRAALP